MRVFDDNSRIILSVLHKNICCGYSLESPWRGDSNEYPQHVFMTKYGKLSFKLSQNTLLICSTEGIRKQIVVSHTQSEWIPSSGFSCERR